MRNELGRTGLTILTLVMSVAALAGLFLLVGQSPAAASSHREAPLISMDPFADNTDTYAFLSPNNPDNIVLVASWIPFEAPEGGPNYYEWDSTVRYEINIDNNGDATADFTYVLSAGVNLQDGNTFLYNTGPIAADGTNWNRQQTFTVTEVTSGGETTLVSNVLAPPVNIGAKSVPNYDQFDDNFIYSITQGGDPIQIFAGQTDDAFWVDLQIFDLLTLRGQAPPVGYSGSQNVPVDSLSGFNVHSLVIEVPVDRLTQGSEPVLGVWATAKRRSMRALSGGLQLDSGPQVQVSRLGMPLVNEVVLPYALKDAFNSVPPAADLSLYTDPTVGNLVQESVENPELGRLLCGLYGVPLPEDGDNDCNTDRMTDVPLSGRGDLFDIFFAGMVLQDEFTINTASGPVTLPAGFNINRPQTFVPAEMIRINTAISGTLCAPTPSRLGVLGGDACGFPNGRRLADDVIDIELAAVAGAAYPVLDGSDTSFTFDPGLLDVLDDGLDGNDRPFSNSFPYLAPANSGDTHFHQNILSTYLPHIVNYSTRVAATAAEEPVATAAASVGSLALLGLPAIVRRIRRREDA